VRRFAAETFAFLIRKLRESEFEGQIDHMLSFISQRDFSETFADGLGQLMFYVVKGIKGQFNSTFPKIFQLMLQRTGTLVKGEDMRGSFDAVPRRTC
jgi:hypothetical protein